MRRTDFTLHSAATHGTRPQSALVPSHASGRPLLVLLHGRNNGASAWTGDEMGRALVKLGADAPVIVAGDGGGGSYWHDRRDGDWERYVVDELIPDAQRRFHTDPQRVAIGGHSMGGFGAFSIAADHPGMFCAVGGHEPAIWQTGGETAPGAFDDAEDFARHDLVGDVATRTTPFGNARLWLDYGESDPFISGDRAFVQALRDHGTSIAVHHWPGQHGMDYVNRHLGPMLRFYARSLKDC